jgi:hypothetical protein
MFMLIVQAYELQLASAVTVHAGHVTAFGVVWQLAVTGHPYESARQAGEAS